MSEATKAAKELSDLQKPQPPKVELNTLLAGIIHNLEYSAYNLLNGKKYTDLPEGITESTGADESLLIAIRDLKELTS